VAQRDTAKIEIDLFGGMWKWRSKWKSENSKGFFSFTLNRLLGAGGRDQDEGNFYSGVLKVQIGPRMDVSWIAKITKPVKDFDLGTMRDARIGTE
jgi:hypothetical protein